MIMNGWVFLLLLVLGLTLLVTLLMAGLLWLLEGRVEWY